MNFSESDKRKEIVYKTLFGGSGSASDLNRRASSCHRRLRRHAQRTSGLRLLACIGLLMAVGLVGAAPVPLFNSAGSVPSTTTVDTTDVPPASPSSPPAALSLEKAAEILEFDDGTNSPMKLFFFASETSSKLAIRLGSPGPVRGHLGTDYSPSSLKEYFQRSSSSIGLLAFNPGRAAACTERSDIQFNSPVLSINPILEGIGVDISLNPINLSVTGFSVMSVQNYIQTLRTVVGTLLIEVTLFIYDHTSASPLQSIIFAQTCEGIAGSNENYLRKEGSTTVLACAGCDKLWVLKNNFIVKPIFLSAVNRASHDLRQDNLREDVVMLINYQRELRWLDSTPAAPVSLHTNVLGDFLSASLVNLGVLQMVLCVKQQNLEDTTLEIISKTNKSSLFKSAAQGQDYLLGRKFADKTTSQAIFYNPLEATFMAEKISQPPVYSWTYNVIKFDCLDRPLEICRQCPEGYFLDSEGAGNKCILQSEIPAGKGIKNNISNSFQSKSIATCKDSKCLMCTENMETCTNCLVELDGNATVTHSLVFPEARCLTATSEDHPNLCGVSNCKVCSRGQCQQCQSGFTMMKSSQQTSCSKTQEMKMVRAEFKQIARTVVLTFEKKLDNLSLEDLKNNLRFTLKDSKGVDITSSLGRGAIALKMATNGMSVSIELDVTATVPQASLLIQNLQPYPSFVDQSKSFRYDQPIEVKDFSIGMSPNGKGDLPVHGNALRALRQTANAINSVGITAMMGMSPANIGASILRLNANFEYLTWISGQYIDLPEMTIEFFMGGELLPFDLISEEVFEDFAGHDGHDACKTPGMFWVHSIRCNILLNYGQDLFTISIILSVSLIVAISCFFALKKAKAAEKAPPKDEGLPKKEE